MSRRQPLRGVRVLDLSAYWAGPAAARLLADMGADVIKVESVQRIDGWRGSYVRAAEGALWELSAAHNHINVNKRGITLNLRSEAGVALCRQLVMLSDVLIENFSPRVMAQFGLDYPALRGLNPRLVMVSLSGFGASGPWRDYVSYALTVECASGVVGLTGYEDGPPLMQAASIGDPLGGLNGGVAALMALYRRRRTGEGCHVDLAQVEAVAALLGDQWLDYAINEREPVRRGNAHPAACPHGVYPCAGEDQWLAIAVLTEPEWHGLCNAMGCPELEHDPRFAMLTARRAHAAELDVLISRWTRTWDKHAAMAALQAAGVPAGAVQDTVETLRDPQLLARGYWQELDRAHVGRHPHAGMGLRLDGAPPALTRPAPGLGEHNVEVLTELLGLDCAAIERLVAEQVIGTEPA